MVLRQVFFAALAGLALASVASAEAQLTAARVPRIAFLTTGSRATYSPGIDALRQGLWELGYVEEKTIRIEYRFAEGKFERLPELAEELAQLKIDLFVASSGTVASAAKKATATIPIVM